MKKSVRNGVFETNSSSVHSMVVMSEEMLEKWKTPNNYLIQKGNLSTYGIDNKKYKKLPDAQVVSQEEAIKIIKSLYGDRFDFSNCDDIDRELNDLCGISSYDDWGSGDFYEFDDCSFTTEHGDKVIALAYYGYDS